MAERRMFSKSIVFSDEFLDMPMSSRNLYFSLCMVADDDGFVNQPKTIIRMVGASSDDISVLTAKKFIIPFDCGVIVIRHWKIHNYIQSDRKHETQYKDLLASITTDKNKVYQIVGKLDTSRIQDVSRMDSEVSIGKSSVDKVSIDKIISADKPRRFTKPTVEDISAYCKERGNAVNPQLFFDFYKAKGWYIGKNPMKDWKAAVRTWEQSEKRNAAAVNDKPSKPPEQERRKFYYTDTDGKVKEGVR